MEVAKTVLLCHNCHNEYHTGMHKEKKQEWNLILKNSESFINNVTDKNPVRKHKTIIKTCPICSVEFEAERSSDRFCSVKCSSVSQQKVKRPDRESLAKMINELSWCEIGRRHGVSDNTIRKWAKRYGIYNKEKDLFP